MASKNSLILAINILVWISVSKVQISSSSNTTVSTNTSMFSVNTSSSTPALTVSPSLLPTSSQSSNKFNESQSTVSFVSDNFTTDIAMTVPSTTAIGSPYTINSSLSTDYKSTANTTITMATASPNYTTDTINASLSSVSSNQTLSIYFNISSSIETSNVTRTEAVKVNQTVSSSITTLNSTMSSVSDYINATLVSTSHITNITTYSTSSEQGLSLGPTSTSITFVNSSQSIKPTMTLSSQEYLSTSTNGSVKASTTNSSSSIFYVSGNISLSVQTSSKSSGMTSYVDQNVMTPSISLLPSQSLGNATVEATSVVEVKPSPMTTTTAVNSTADSIQTSSHVQTVVPSVNDSLTSPSLLPSPTSTVNVNNQSSSITDDMIVMSYTTPCYITYVITKTINETTVRPTTVAMETSSSNASVSPTPDTTVSGTLNTSSTSKTPMITTSKMSIVGTIASSNSSMVMETSSVKQTSSSIQMVNTTSIEPHSSSEVQTNTSSSINMTSTRMITSYNTTMFPTPVLPSVEISLDNNTNSKGTINSTVVMTTMTSHKTSTSSYHTSNTSMVTTVLSQSPNSSVSASVTHNSSSVASDLKESMNNTASFTLTTTKLSSVSSTPSPNVSASLNHTTSSSSSVYNETRTPVTNVSTLQTSSTHSTTMNTTILPSGTVATSASSSASTSGTPALPNTTSNAEATPSSTVNTTGLADITLGPSSVFNSSVVTSTPGVAKKRRRRAAPLVNNSVNSTVNSSLSQTINITTVAPSSTFSSSSLQGNSTLGTLDTITTNRTVGQSTMSTTNTSIGNATVPTVTMTTSLNDNLTSGQTTSSVNMTTVTPSTSLMNTNTSVLNTSFTAKLTSNTSLVSASSKTINITSSMAATSASFAMTTATSLAPGIYPNSSLSIYATPQTSSVAGSSSTNSTNTSGPTVPLVSASHVSSTMTPTSNSSSVFLETNQTSSISNSSSVNRSSTVPPVTVVMTTPTVAMSTFTTNTSNLNITKVPETLSAGLSSAVSPSKSLHVTSSSSSDISVNQSHVVNSTSASPTSYTTLTPTPIYPTPQLTSLTPSNTTSDITSGVSSSRKNIFLTTSSMGICYVIYTTRTIQPSTIPSPTSVTGLNQTTGYTMSTESLVNTSYMMVSSITSSKSRVEMNSTILQMALSTTLNINITSSSISTQQSSSAARVNATPTLNSTQSSGYASNSVPVNSTSMSRIATSVTSVVSMATTNSTVYPSTSSVIVDVSPSPSSSSQVINSSSSRVIVDESPLSSSSLSQVINSSSSRVVVNESSSSSAAASSSSPLINSFSVFSTSTSTSSSFFTSSQTSSKAISPSATSVVMATSSVVTTPLPTTTAVPAPDSSTLIKTTLQIPRDIDENTAELRRNVSKGLEETYNVANGMRRRRRATEGTEAKIYNITRKPSPSTDAMVLFSIARNGKTLSANEAVAVYNRTDNLTTIGVWKVASRPEPLILPTPPPQSILVSMIFEKIVRNLSVPSNKKALEDKLASYYKDKKKTTATVTATIHVVLLEKTNHVYIQFYVTEDGKQVPAATVVQVFEVEHVQQLTAYLQEQVIVAPYTDESLRGRKTDYVQTRISPPPSTNIQDPAFHRELGDRLARAYIDGKAKGSSRRKRRAVGSVSATIVNSTAVNGSSGFADVIFFIFDSGKVANATYAAATFGRLTKNEMSIITSPYAIIKMPYPVVVPMVTETPPATIAPVVIPYWIIGAVLGPIFLIIIIILLIYWRWKSGAPQSKVQPAVQKTPEHLRKPKMQPMQTHDVVRYAESKPPVSKISSMSVNTERSYENLPRRETSLRRKVHKTTMQKRGEVSRINAAYEESEEDEDYDNSFITMSSTSQSRIVTAQPGPGIKDRQTLSVPVRSTPRKTPQKIREESEEMESDSSESEAESIATTRTDQTKYSAAQVPTVAVMGGSSGNQPQVPVRFRSSVHPASSLPPIRNKQTSLVGPPTDDQEEVTPRKSKRRSRAAQQELKQKADMERLRNKKRQRERKNKVTPVQSSERRAWARDELEQVLDPKPIDPFSRSKRRKAQRSKRADSVATDQDAIELKSYRRHTSPEDSMKQQPKDEEETEDQSGESSDDSSISMEETRKRIHTLLDDAFSLLGPLSQKQKQKPRTSEGPGDYYNRPPVPARYAGSRPALPEPAPAHGRATEPTPRQRRRLGNTGGFPHGIPQTPIGPGYPVRPPVRPPLVTSDPVVVWDPYDRQRYINHRMGFQPQAGPNPTYTYTDPQGQNVYITPVQQQRDYLGGQVWSPYTAEDTMEDLYPDLAKSNYPGSFGTSPPKDPGYRDVNSRDTVIDMNDQYGQRGPALGQAPQPLIRSIKDELLRLSNGGARRTPITEL